MLESALPSVHGNRERRSLSAIRCGQVRQDSQPNKTGQAAGEVRRRASLRMSLRAENSPGDDRVPSRRSNIPSTRRHARRFPFRTQRTEKPEAAQIVQTIHWPRPPLASPSSAPRRRETSSDPCEAPPYFTAPKRSAVMGTSARESAMVQRRTSGRKGWTALRTQCSKRGAFRDGQTNRLSLYYIDNNWFVVLD